MVLSEPVTELMVGAPGRPTVVAGHALLCGLAVKLGAPPALLTASGEGMQQQRKEVGQAAEETGATATPSSQLDKAARALPRACCPLHAMVLPAHSLNMYTAACGPLTSLQLESPVAGARQAAGRHNRGLHCLAAVDVKQRGKSRP